MKKNSDADVGKIREKLSDISRDEQRRVKEIFREHQEFFKGSTSKKEDVAIDFYENWRQTIVYTKQNPSPKVCHQTDVPWEHSQYYTAPYGSLVSF